MGELMRADINKFSEVVRSPRVMQLEGIFDMPPSERSEEKWHVEFELPNEWGIGLIVGPSGSGKTTIARALFGDAFVSEWSDDASILDSFPKSVSVREIVALLSSVGFTSPPNWLRPYGVLSTGEQFRVSVARALAEQREITVIDEFTSVVDRTVAKVASAAVSKAVRKRGQKLVAVSCHYDVIEWLEPDWIYQPATNEFLTCQDSSGRYKRQRPKIAFRVSRVHRQAWELFRKFHYLDHNLNSSSLCYVAYWENRPVAFIAMLSFPHAKSPSWRIHRLVVLPDYQGIGIGVRLMNYMASIFSANKRVTIVMSQPALISSCSRSKDWFMYRSPKLSPRIGRTSAIKGLSKTVATSRFTAGFRYVGEIAEPSVAEMALGRRIS